MNAIVKFIDGATPVRLRRLLLPVLAAASLAGCLNQPSKPDAKAAPTPVAAMPAEPVVTVSSDVRGDFETAMARMNAEDYKGGIAILDRVIAASPKLAVPYINRAIAHGKLGNHTAAEEDLKRALEIEPGNPVANNEFGLLYRRTGRFAEARKLYEGLLERYPYYPIVHKNLGILCDLYLRDYQCALREYEAFQSAEPDDKNIKIWIADVQRRLGK